MEISIKESASPDAQPNKRRRKKSMVWDHFTVENVTPDSVRAFCNQCRKSFAYISGSKVSGTSHLKRHIALGICPVGRIKQEKNQVISHVPPPVGRVKKEENQVISHVPPPVGQMKKEENQAISHVPPPVNGTNIPRKRCHASNGVTSTYFDGDSCTYELAKMVIQHNYPLDMVEHSGFLDFSRCLQPLFNIPSVSLLHEQIMGIYVREKQKLVGLVNGIPGRLNLTVDLCISNQSLGYVLLTGHFTDHDWKLQRRILNVTVAWFPDSDTTFAHAISACLGDWGIEDKLFSVTLDLTHADQRVTENVRNLLPVKNNLILKGQLLVNSCYARTLWSLAQLALGSIRETIQKVRQSVKYIINSDSNEERFIKLKQQLQVPSTKDLMIDDSTRWNTTYQMLVAASEVKEVFLCLDTFDPDYVSTLSMKEWGQVEILCSYLKIFYEAANILTSSVYPTTNSFFDIVCRIYFELIHAAASHDSFVSTLTKPLLRKFAKYWEDCNLVLTVAVVMDPRFKMKFVEFSFSRGYGEDAESWIKLVYEILHDLYLEYAMQSLPVPMIEAGTGSHDHLVKTEEHYGLLPDADVFDFDVDVTDILAATHEKSDLDRYLEESVLPRVQDFDVLGWWRVNSSKYPTLSKLASDVLTIPLSTGPPESVFDAGERKMDSHLSSLKPKTLQALICAKDWLHHPYATPSQLGIVKTEQ